MPDIGKILLVLVAVFLLEAFLYNIIKPNLPKIPGDISIDRPGLTIYIPFVSTLLISVIITLLFNFFRN